ncbi:probable E3 ubiquitin-protein ligase bre1 [Camellia sinensis]|uniref:probable E3 ubiquitin-protein ligase bre1 n=1 Tax=Camellia sinensis TaxID=4442 RepID=UPI00103621B0|nr:probable E3 ubiquitin-protein ligase bre1 [Camellia sinensis]
MEDKVENIEHELEVKGISGDIEMKWKIIECEVTHVILLFIWKLKEVMEIVENIKDKVDEWNDTWQDKDEDERNGPYTQLKFPKLFDNLNNIKKHNWVEAIKDTLMNSMANANNNPSTGTVSIVNSSDHPTNKASQEEEEEEEPDEQQDNDEAEERQEAKGDQPEDTDEEENQQQEQEEQQTNQQQEVNEQELTNQQEELQEKSDIFHAQDICILTNREPLYGNVIDTFSEKQLALQPTIEEFEKNDLTIARNPYAGRSYVFSTLINE